MKHTQKLTCTECLLEKEPEEFSRANRAKILTNRICKPCNHVKKHGVPLNRYKVEQNKLARKNWKVFHPEQAMLKCCKSNARTRGIPFEITIDDIKIPETCPILGISLNFDLLKGSTNPNKPSIDRIDSSKGYVKGNIIVISWRANRLKSNATYKEIKKLYRFLKRYHEANSQYTSP